jgi:hypothetical protein
MLVCTVPCTSVCHSTVFADNIHVIFPAELIVFEISISTCEILFQKLYLIVSYQHLYMLSSGIYLKFIFSCIASISLKHNQHDATFSRSIYFYKLLFIFQAVPPPIIRSTKLYIQRQVLSNQYCC